MIKEYSNIFELLQDPQPELSGNGLVKGYYTPGDNGGGVFYWDQNSIEPEDFGTIFKSSSFLLGRWKRLFNKSSPVLAEWFGIRPNSDDITIASTNLSRINLCLRNFKRIKFGSGFYSIYQTDKQNSICLESSGPYEPGPTIEGSGIDITVIKMLTTSSGADRLAVITTLGWPVNNVVIKDMTIDCGFDYVTDKSATRQAILLRGVNNLVERIKFINYGAGNHTNRAECFVVSLLLTPANEGFSSKSPGNIRDCIFTRPGKNGNLSYSTGIPEITCILIDRDDPSQKLIGCGGLIENNIFENIKVKAGEQISPLHGISVGRLSGAKIVNNVFSNFDGTCVYQDSFNSQNLLVSGNTMENVHIGVCFLIVSPILDPIFEGTVIEKNFIRLGLASPDSSIPPHLSGIIFYSLSGITGNRINNVLVSNNFIRGRKVGSLLPTGVRIECHEIVYDNFRVENNIIDTPDTLALSSEYFGIEGEESLVFIPDYRYDPARLKFHNNLTSRSKHLNVKVTRGGVKLLKNSSDKIERVKNVVYDGRVNCLYDEFMGASPGFSLGWSNWGKVTNYVGDIDRPGIVQLSVTSPPETAELKLAPNSIRLSPSTSHVMEFNFSRFANTSPTMDYEAILGLIGQSSNSGIYLKVDNSSQGQIMLHISCGNTSTSIPTNEFAWAGWWFKARFEIKQGEVSFWINDRWVSRFINKDITGNFTPIFKVKRLSGNLLSGILIDYFQYQFLYE